MPINVHSLLTPAIARQWEFALSEPGFEIRYDRVLACPGCGEAHQRVFMETEWDENETDYPERSVVITVLQHQGATMLFVDHFEQGERQVRATFQVEKLDEFIRAASQEVAEALRALRRVSLTKTVERSEDRVAACLN